MTQQPPRNRSLPDPGLIWQPDRTPFASRFGDVYFSREGGLAETRHVFLGGCGLPEAWQSSQAFTVGELGFGTGLNFLTTWELWRRTKRPGTRLHYVAVEGYPLDRAALVACLEAWPELKPLTRGLLRVYPEPQAGFHRLFPVADGESNGDVHLTLLCGDAAEVLAQLEADVDAWFLDGFSPEKNPDMWTSAVFAEVARVSHAGTRLATYSAAGDVRRGLDAAGFSVEKATGFGKKREMLRGYFRGGQKPHALQPWFARPVRTTVGHAAIIGGGIAGTNVAHALRRRGWHTTILDRRSVLADEASGNPAGVLMPRLTAASSLDGRFYAAAWRYMLTMLADVSPEARCGTLQLATNLDEVERQAAIGAAAPLPESLLMNVAADAASDIAGVKISHGALYFPQGGWVSPRAYCAVLAHGTKLRLGVHVANLRHNGVQWEVLGPAGEVHAPADVVVLANALDAAALPLASWLPLQARRGQITFAPPTAASTALRSVLTYGGYITPSHEGVHSIGATFDWVEPEGLKGEQPVRDQDNARNLDELARVLPGLMNGADARNFSGRAGLRCTTLDHLALAGPLPDHERYMMDFAELRHGHPWARYPQATYRPGLYTLTGLGARGLVSAPLAAELIASQISGEALPMERDLYAALHPGRFLVRGLKRGA